MEETNFLIGRRDFLLETLYCRRDRPINQLTSVGGCIMNTKTYTKNLTDIVVVIPRWIIHNSALIESVIN